MFNVWYIRLNFINRRISQRSCQHWVGGRGMKMLFHRGKIEDFVDNIAKNRFKKAYQNYSDTERFFKRRHIRSVLVQKFPDSYWQCICIHKDAHVTSDVEQGSGKGRRRGAPRRFFFYTRYIKIKWYEISRIDFTITHILSFFNIKIDVFQKFGNFGGISKRPIVGKIYYFC